METSNQEVRAGKAAMDQTRGVRRRSVPLVAVELAALWWAITHGEGVIASVLVVVATLGPMVAAYVQRGKPLHELFIGRGASLGFLAQPLLLGPAAYVAAENWDEHAQTGWQGWFAADTGADLWRWTAIALVAGITFAVFTRIGERPNYHPLEYFSRLKTIHDWRSHPVALTLVAFLAAAVLAGWDHGGKLVLALIVGWFLLGMVDLWRTSWKGSFRFDRSVAHPREPFGYPEASTFDDSRMTTTEFFRRLRDLRRDRRGYPQPG